MGKTVTEKFKRIKRLFKQKAYERVIDHCATFLQLHQSDYNYDVCLYLAQSHFELNEFAQGASAIEDAKKIVRDQGKLEQIAVCDAILKKAWTRLVMNVKSGLSILDLESLSSAEKARTAMRESNYVKALERLKNNHQCIRATFSAQVEHIIQLMNFFLQTYADKKKYIKAEYLDDSPVVKSTRLKIANMMLLSGLTQNEFLFPGPDKLELLAQLEIEGHCKDIYLDDAQLVLRMMFKTIHALPRDKCKELVHLLPWGSNSWYFLYFIGSLMNIGNSKFFNTILSLGMKVNNSTEETSNAVSYFLSLCFSNCTLKVALLDQDFCEDLRKLGTFFEAIQENLRANSDALKPDQLPKLDELPTLKKLVWYFKHLYNLYRLKGFLPNAVTEGTLMHKSDIELVDSQRNPMALLLKMDLMGSIPCDLKSQLAFIRRLQLIGELFTRKNWGFFLNTMDYFDPLAVINIRNALVHIEQITRSEVIFRLEADTNRLHQLHIELSHLKSYLLEVVLKARDTNFKPFPPREKMNSIIFWLKDVTEYWESAKTYYGKQFTQFKFEDDPSPLYKENFIPGQEILKSNVSIINYRHEGRIRKLLGMSDDSDINFAVYIQYLRKVFADHQELLTELELVFQGKKALNKEKLFDKVFNVLSMQDSNLPIVKGLIEAAELYSNELRKEKREAFEIRHAKFEEELAKRDEARKDAVKKKMQTNYPYITDCAAELESELNGNQPSVSSLVDTLKNRIKLLQTLFKDNGTVITAETQGIIAIQKHLASDVSLYFATSYLVGQIVSLFNKLYSLGELKEIHPELNLLLVDYVGLRNALEHSDPFMDSEHAHQLLMDNKLPDATAYMICEIVCCYGAHIEAYSPKAHATISKAGAPTVDAGKVKQVEAVDIGKFISSCDKRMKDFRASPIYIRPSASGFFSGAAVSPRSLLNSSAVMPLENINPTHELGPDYMLISPQFSSASKLN
ncbi:tetratricopeptide repeat protein [Legionella maioricensis]|uniref:Uncharacterized protein n=1 Tax=Legionella maioricensis TaxID=2896528 RepID=A0A9X2D0K7_9GAMM|nr:hypothetical protein [Legionella maioricensis]MCL9684211.1 hypothetical protein [Legionella maioricensis]MCL9687077.1 hypothetical protein [Legionella maioricensis]